MCGIFGYIGKRDPLQTCLQGLKLLEYRGYDSSGIAGIEKGHVVFFKEVGKLSVLEEKVKLSDLKLDLAIGHTRWATHGKPDQVNAHPHCDSKSFLALVHNGIIENYDALRTYLKSLGIPFVSETDTEVIAQLISHHYKGNLLTAVSQSLEELKGTFAIALIHKDHPDTIIAASRESPLAIAYNDDKTESFISSDPNAFLGHNLNVCFLKNDEIAIVQKRKVEIYDRNQKPIRKIMEKLRAENISLSKEGYKHYMLKEIHEQPFTIQKAMLPHISEDESNVDFHLPLSPQEIDRIMIVACGTSWHAASLGTYLFEDLAHIPTSAEIASELRFKTHLLTPKTLVIAISQSGETADTLGAIRELKAKGAKVLGICNVKNSTITREVDSSLFLHAGPEFSVCSTKAFSSQLTLLSLLALFLARQKGLQQKEECKIFLQELKKIPEKIQEILDRSSEIQDLAKKYCGFKDFFFLGRRTMYPTCLEAALKLKEISYQNANGYPAGEMKHGPIALISPSLPVIAFCANEQTYDKIINNLMEVKARGAPILAFANEGVKGLEMIADDVFYLPRTIDLLAPFPSTVAGQLLAYYIACELGRDVDQPRNLAKSVTVD